MSDIRVRVAEIVSREWAPVALNGLPTRICRDVEPFWGVTWRVWVGGRCFGVRPSDDESRAILDEAWQGASSGGRLP